MNRIVISLGLLLALASTTCQSQQRTLEGRRPASEASKAGSLLVRLDGSALKAADFREQSVGGYRLQPLMGSEPYQAKGADRAVTWLIAIPREAPRKLAEQTAGEQWSAAHVFWREYRSTPAFRSAQSVYVEPNLKHMAYHGSKPSMSGGLHCDLSKEFNPPQVEYCKDQSQDCDQGKSFAWHLDDAHTQLATARKEKGGTCNSFISILDTGIRATHHTTPRKIDPRGYDFVDGDDDVEDPGPGTGGKNSGHGTATLALLAGDRVRVVTKDPRYKFDDDLGGAPDAHIVPLRIADSVVHFYSSEMASGIAYAAELAKQDGSKTCHVVSISMGGLAARAWADAVNEAYDNGVTIVAAAGNNFGGLPTRYTVYPSRFARVITAAGATATHQPYTHGSFGMMSGNWGPPSVMEKALAAYTPNTPWADYEHNDVVDLDGAGTSSATPQIAAAAALWLGKYGARYPADWHRVAAVRNALFASANTKLPTPEINTERYGRGLLRAADAMKINPGAGAKSPPAEVSFPFWRILLGLDEPGYVNAKAKSEEEEVRMYEVESLNLISERDEGEEDFSDLTSESLKELPLDASNKGRRMLDRLCSHPDASSQLKVFMGERRKCG